LHLTQLIFPTVFKDPRFNKPKGFIKPLSPGVCQVGVQNDFFGMLFNKKIVEQKIDSDMTIAMVLKVESTDFDTDLIDVFFNESMVHFSSQNTINLYDPDSAWGRLGSLPTLDSFAQFDFVGF